MMVWNVTRDSITERMAEATEEAWSVPGPRKPPAGKPGQVEPQLSEKILAGSWDVSDAEDRMVGEFMKKYNLKPQQK